MIRTLPILLMLIAQCGVCLAAEEEELIEVGQPARQGDVEIRIKKLGIGYVQLDNFGDASESKNKLFIILLEITNLTLQR